MMRRTVTGLVLALCAANLSAESPQRVSDLLALPPAFEALIGDPVIEWETGSGVAGGTRLLGLNVFRPKRGFGERGGSQRLILRAEPVSDATLLGERVARFLAEAFHRKVLSEESLNWHERRLGIDQLFIPEEERFVELAARKLAGKPTLEPWFDAWWKVRMGLPQTPDPSHHLVLINQHRDHFGRKISTGHFCFALRKRGGDAENDVLFEFRAPWELDRPHRVTEGLNFHNRLLLSATAENLYDWLYTQTEYRHCHVDCWFLPVSKEQVTLLRHIADRPVVHEAGQFRAFRKNCASLGLAFLHRLEPIGTPLPLGRGLADIPAVAVRRVLENYESEAPYFRLTNVTHERGREATAKSEIRRAQPTRADSRAFCMLRSVPEVN